MGNPYRLSITSTGAGWDEGSANPQPIPVSAVPQPIVLPPSTASYNAYLKFCDGANGAELKAAGISTTGISVPQGTAHSVDIDNGANGFNLQGEIGVGGEAQGNEVLMTKYGCHHLKFDLTFHARGKFWDICIDQIMDKKYDPLYSHDLDYTGCKHVDGKPLRVCLVHQPWSVIFGNYTQNNLVFGSSCKVTVFWSVLSKLWWYAVFLAGKI